MIKISGSLRLTLTVYLLIGILPLRSLALSNIQYRRVAQSGTQAAGMPPGVNFAGFSNPRVNNLGQVVFNGELVGTGINSENNFALWSEGGGTLHVVAHRGLEAPGTAPGVRYSSGGATIGPNFSNNGLIAFNNTLEGAGVDSTNGSGIWVDVAGNVSLLARTGSAAPGVGENVNFSSVGLSAINGAGQIAFLGTLVGEGIDATNNRGIWSNAGGNLLPIARSGWAAPGTAQDITFLSFGGPQSIDDEGRTGFGARLAGPGIDSTNDTGIWQEHADGLSLLAREGSQAPGTESGVLFGDLSFSPQQIGGGKIAFSERLRGSGVNATNDSGVWSQAGGELHLVAREGSPKPGMAPSDNFGDLASVTPEFNDLGEAAFVTVDAAGQSIWSEGGGNLHLVAKTGMAAPGTEPGVTFTILGGPGDQVINNGGRVAFEGEITGPGVNQRNNYGIWAEGPNGLELVIRTGQELPLENGVPGIVRAIDFSRGYFSIGPFSGRGFGFSDQNQLAFTAYFGSTITGVRSVFVADLGNVPEPSAAMLLLTAMMFTALYRVRP